MIRVGKVVERGQIDGKDTHSGTTQGEGWYDPWYGRVGRPSKPEQTDGHEDRFDAGEVETTFRSIGHLSQSHGQFLLVDAQESGQESSNGHRCGLSVMDRTQYKRFHSPENTAPTCCTLKPWLVEKTRGIELKLR